MENITLNQLAYDVEKSEDGRYYKIKDIDKPIAFKGSIPLEQILSVNKTSVFIYGLYDDSGIRYVGKTINLIQRYNSHIAASFDKNKREYNTFKARWIRKHISELRCLVLEICNNDTWEEAERFWIKCYKDTNNILGFPELTNGTDGGDKNYNYLEGVRKKISDKRKRTKQSRETINKQIESRKKLYVAQYSLNGDFIKKWNSIKEAAAFYNVSAPVLNKAIHCKTRTCRNFIWRAYKLNEDYEEHVEPYIYKREVLQFDMEGNFIREWNSPKEASEAVNISASTLWHCLKGKHSICAGYTWKYKNIE